MPSGVYKRTDEQRKKISETLKRKGIKPPSYLGQHHKLSEETKKKMSEGRKGEKNYWFGKHLSTETKQKISNIKKLITGENTSNWKGGITPINNRIRRKIEYRLWREAVFARDSWTC